MKKTLLVVLMMLVVATPCFSQKIEPEGIFSIEGTLWNECSVYFPSLYPYSFFDVTCNLDFGFHQGRVYRCNNAGLGYSCWQTDAKYIDTPVISIVYEVFILIPPGILLAIMQPSGFGVFTAYLAPISFMVGIMSKTDDNWTPPDVE
jgi:hypothetical protein